MVAGRGIINGSPVEGFVVRWMAQHFDGFTSRMLFYNLRVEDGVAELEASWSLPRPPTSGFRARFAIDEAPVVQILPALRAMGERYELPCTDLDHKVLEVEVSGECIRRHVYGFGRLFRGLGGERSELQQYLGLFEWLERQVVARLPWDPT